MNKFARASLRNLALGMLIGGSIFAGTNAIAGCQVNSDGSGTCWSTAGTIQCNVGITRCWLSQPER